MDELEQIILSSGSGAKVVPPDELSGFGKRAAAEFVRGGSSLNDAVTKIAQEQGLNENQTRRVIEEANTAAFLHKFKNRDFDKNIEFDVADPSVVLRKEASTVKTAAPIELPKRESLSPTLFDIDGLFPVEEGAEKVASHDGPDALDVYYRYRHLQTDKLAAVTDYNIARDEFVDVCRKTMLNGQAPALVKSAAVTALEAAGAEKAEEVAEHFLGEYFDVIQRNVELPKLATVNTEHPVYKVATAFAEAIQRYQDVCTEQAAVLAEYTGPDIKELRGLVDALEAR